MKYAVAHFFLALSGVCALPTDHLRRSDWLTTQWDVIVVGGLETQKPSASVTLADQISRQARDQQESL